MSDLEVIRYPCKTPTCNATILIETIQDTGGFCRPCFKNYERIKREEYIRKNRKTLYLYEGITSPLEIIKIFHKTKIQDPLTVYAPYQGSISNIYKQLNEEEIRYLIDHSVMLYNNKEIEGAKTISSCLIAFTTADISDFLMEMVKSEDYYPSYLFKNSSSKVRKNLLDKFLEDKEVDENKIYQKQIFEPLIWVDEGESHHNKNKIAEAVSNFRRPAFVVKEEACVNFHNGFKKSILGDINIKKNDEEWPSCNGVPLNPVIQLAISDLPYIPPELEDIDYLCVYIHPDDPGALWDKDDALVIKSYKNDEIVFQKRKELTSKKNRSKILIFKEKRDYPFDHLYPTVKDYLTHTLKEYNWKNEFNKESENYCDFNNIKILGWPNWIQWPEFPDDSDFIIQIEHHDLWEYGDSSTLYIFRDRITKDFSGFIQMY